MKRVLFIIILLLASVNHSFSDDLINKKRAFIANELVQWAGQVKDWQDVKKNLRTGQIFYFGPSLMGSLAPFPEDQLLVLNKEPLMITRNIDSFGLFTKQEIWLSKGDKCEPIVIGMIELVAMDGEDLAFEYVPEKSPRMIDLMGWYSIDPDYFNFHTKTCPAGVIFPQTVKEFIQEQESIAYRYAAAVKEVADYEKRKAINDAREQSIAERNDKLSELAEKAH